MNENVYEITEWKDFLCANMMYTYREEFDLLGIKYAVQAYDFCYHLLSLYEKYLAEQSVEMQNEADDGEHLIFLYNFLCDVDFYEEYENEENCKRWKY